MLNKSTQQNYPTTTDFPSVTDRLQLVTTDLSGPITPTALGGYRYMAKFTDNFNTLRVVYFIKGKSEALSTLCKFIQDVAIPQGLRVHHLRSDRGGEFTGEHLRRYCKITGIIQQFTTSYTPQQNGMSEETILNITRCLLNEGHFPKYLWGEIAATAVFLLNRLPHSSINGETTYYRMFGKQVK
ncbi:unnamed protein product [Sphacelaria rigidula]